MSTYQLLLAATLLAARVSATAVLTPTTGWSLLAWGEAKPVDSVTGQQVVIVDLFDTSAADIKALVDHGHIVTCYYSAGTSEEWRDDVKANVAGWNDVATGTMAQWGGEAWLDIFKLDELKALMTPRIQLAAKKGCSAVEPDNTDCFTNPDECKISGTKAEKRAAQLAYNVWTAEAAHAHGMLCALKNTGDLVGELAAIHDFAVVEQCLQYNECDVYEPFYDEGKPIFGIEYQVVSASKCAAAVNQHVQMKHCAGSPSAGICKKKGSKKPLENCYSEPTWEGAGNEDVGEDSQNDGSGGGTPDETKSCAVPRRGRRLVVAAVAAATACVAAILP